LETLHVISFDVPYPANYGGVIVVYHQLLAWKAAGVKVILHAYRYGSRTEQAHLAEVCEEVHYYDRVTGLRSSLSSLPYIVNSRKSDGLLKRLQQDSYPIFFEGVHTTAWINHPTLADRKKVVRMHNVEWQYYESLQSLTANRLRKNYFYFESRRLKKYDAHVIEHADALISISEKDQKYYSALHENCHYMPAPHGERYTVKEGLGEYFLFHGKLSVEDNKQAALHLMKNVFSKTSAQFIIAGLDPDEGLKAEVDKMQNVQLQSNLSDAEMKALIANAQGNVLYTFQDSGLKLKLLHALHLGRHCIVNNLMVSNAPELAPLCEIGESDEALISAIKKLGKKAFTKSNIEKREAILTKKYDNYKNAKLALDFLKNLGF